MLYVVKFVSAFAKLGSQKYALVIQSDKAHFTELYQGLGFGHVHGEVFLIVDDARKLSVFVEVGDDSYHTIQEISEFGDSVTGDTGCGASFFNLNISVVQNHF